MAEHMSLLASGHARPGGASAPKRRGGSQSARQSASRHKLHVEDPEAIQRQQARHHALHVSMDGAESDEDMDVYITSRLLGQRVGSIVTDGGITKLGEPKQPMNRKIARYFLWAGLFCIWVGIMFWIVTLIFPHKNVEKELTEAERRAILGAIPALKGLENDMG